MLERSIAAKSEQFQGLPYRESPKFPTQGTLAQRRSKVRDNNIAMALMQNGASIRTVAQVFGVSPATVHLVKMRYLGSQHQETSWPAPDGEPS